MLYVHIPFCHRKCTYCAFYSTPSASLRAGFVDALLREIHLRGTGHNAPVQTVYFGGGTPSLLPLHDLRRIVDTLASVFDLGRVREATIECNPEDLSPDYVSGLRQIGLFNRISLGVQSFDDSLLRLVGRRHTAAQATAAVETLSQAGFDNITVDLIYGIPGLDNNAWLEAVTRAAALPVKHISAYALTVEEGTALHRQVESGRLAMPDDDVVVSQYHILCRTLRSAGFEHYEVSNFARPGFASQHNSRYWDRTPYLGFGPAAHSFDGLRRRWNVSDVARYVSSLGEGGGWYGEELLSDADARNEAVMTGLRTARGIPHRLASPQQMQPYIQRGWIVDDGTAYRPTESGMLYADGMASDLFV